MHDIMQDMFRSVLEGSRQAHIQQATPTAAQPSGSRRQAQQHQQQAAAPLQAQLLHAQQQLQQQQQQLQHQPPPATSPAPAPAAASPARAEQPPAWMSQPPPWWGTPPPTPRAAHDQGRQTQQPPPDPHRNNQHNPQQHQGGPALKAGMLPPGQQPRPPPLGQALSPANGQGKEHFTVKGRPAQKFHPFANQFGGALRDEMSRIYDADKDPEKTTAKAHCRPVMSAIRKATGWSSICDKWITTGRCRMVDCQGSHPDWEKEWNGQWLTAQCPELAAMAKVPLDWTP